MKLRKTRIKETILKNGYFIYTPQCRGMKFKFYPGFLIPFFGQIFVLIVLNESMRYEDLDIPSEEEYGTKDEQELGLLHEYSRLSPGTLSRARVRIDLNIYRQKVEIKRLEKIKLKRNGHKVLKTRYIKYP